MVGNYILSITAFLVFSSYANRLSITPMEDVLIKALLGIAIGTFFAPFVFFKEFKT
jgi:hypothetical protein